MSSQINAGDYNKRIQILCTDGNTLVLSVWAKVKTTKGFTLIQNNSDFEKAFTNFTIRFPKKEILREMFVKYKDKLYSIEYLNDIDEESIELEIQAKMVAK